MCRATSPEIKLSARATDPDGDTLLYTYTTDGGRVSGEGPEVTLDLTGVAPGVYAVTVEIDDGHGGVATDTAKIEVARCTCDPPPTPMLGDCPWVTVSCPDTGVFDQPITFVAGISGGDPAVTPTYKWTVPGFRILSGQGTSAITVEPPAHGGTVVATVEVGGYDRACSMTASCTTSIIVDPSPSKVGEYIGIVIDDEKSQLANFAIVLQNDPTAQGYVICYGGRHGGAGEAQRRCDRARSYLVNTRGIDASRIVTVDGGFREEPTAELWLVPRALTRRRARRR
jgi:hypothetical protein